MGGKSKNHGRQVNRAKARKAGGKTTELEKELASFELKELLKDDTFLAGGMLYSTARCRPSKAAAVPVVYAMFWRNSCVYHQKKKGI